MLTQLKLANVNTHIVDILRSVKGRDQSVMKMNKAIGLVKCLDKEIFLSYGKSPFIFLISRVNHEK